MTEFRSKVILLLNRVIFDSLAVTPLLLPRKLDQKVMIARRGGLRQVLHLL